MDSKTFNSRLARSLKCDTKCVADLMSALASVVGEKASELDTVAVSGLGDFVAVKRPEHILTDEATGKRMLMPPNISVEFVAGTVLKNRLSHE